MVSATYRNGGDRFGVTYLELTDRSASGMGVRTRTRLEPGMTVTICPEGSTVPWLATTVARCEADADGFYRAGLTFSSRIAA